MSDQQMSGINHFAEGADAYMAWINDGTWNNQCPESPYPAGSDEDQMWEQGFDDAMSYMLYSDG